MARCEAPDPTIVRDKIGQSPDTPVGDARIPSSRATRDGRGRRTVSIGEE